MALTPHPLQSLFPPEPSPELIGWVAGLTRWFFLKAPSLDLEAPEAELCQKSKLTSESLRLEPLRDPRIRDRDFAGNLCRFLWILHKILEFS